MRPLLLVTLATAALPAMAAAAPWKIDPAASTLTFTGSQADEPFTGSFTQFTPVVEFDPAKPENASIAFTVDIASAKIEDKDNQETLPTEDWFHNSKYTTASFISTRVTALSSEKAYLAEGNLTLHGISQPVQLKFSFTEQNGTATVDGGTVLQRNRFGIGSGQWKSDEWIAYPVTVKFHIIATKG